MFKLFKSYQSEKSSFGNVAEVAQVSEKEISAYPFVVIFPSGFVSKQIKGRRGVYSDNTILDLFPNLAK